MLLPFLRNKHKTYIEKLYANYRDTLLLHAKRFGLDSASAEDALQICFEKMIPKSDFLEGLEEYHAKAYLIVALQNTAIDMLRKQKRCTFVEKIEHFPDHQKQEQMDFVCDAIDLQIAMRELNTAHKEIIFLAYTLDLDNAHIADLLNIPIHSVKMRKHRAVKKLRGILTEGSVSDEQVKNI